MDKRVCLEVTTVDSAKKSVGISPVDGKIRQDEVSEVNTAPGSVMISEDGVRNVEMFHLAVKEGTDIKEDELVGVGVSVVVLLKMQKINGAVDNAPAYKPAEGTERFNNMGNQIIDFKKVMVVILIDFCFLEF